VPGLFLKERGDIFPGKGAQGGFENCCPDPFFPKIGEELDLFSLPGMFMAFPFFCSYEPMASGTAEELSRKAAGI
jgi:hypothetical protein